jgi:hypothetical protein
MFQVIIAILKLTKDDLLELDMAGINDYFKDFKLDQGLLDDPLTPSSNKGRVSTLPPIDTII